MLKEEARSKKTIYGKSRGKFKVKFKVALVDWEEGFLLLLLSASDNVYVTNSYAYRLNLDAF
jgi:hypothetical protein